MKYVDNVLLKKELFNLYKGLILHNGWNLSRSSSGEDIGTFPGFVVKDGNQIHDNYWNGYFTSLYERIKINFQEKYKYHI